MKPRLLSTFSIRDVLLCTIIVALVIALCLSRNELAELKGRDRALRIRANALQAVLELEGFAVKLSAETNDIEWWSENGRSGSMSLYGFGSRDLQ